MSEAETDWADEMAINLGCDLPQLRRPVAAALRSAFRRGEASGMRKAAEVAALDADWTRFGKPATEPFENGPDEIREYRLGITTGRSIAAAIRAHADEIEKGGA